MPKHSRILFLGAAPTQVPPLKYARERGYYVVTCDNVPGNIGHRYADESHDVSTTDVEAVLALARRVGIDGVVAYASDPAAPTAAYVGNALGLPSNPYESVLTLARKDLFREFQAQNRFHVPRSRSFVAREEARSFLKELTLPVFVKPVDSSGSKGITRLIQLDDFDLAFDHALRFSRIRKVVVEEGIRRDGYQVAGDGFVVDGRLAFRCFGNEHFDERCNGLVPIGESFPAVHGIELQQKAHVEIERILRLLGISFGALNFDFVFDEAGEVHFLEIGPRNGGNRIPDVVKLATGVDMIALTVETALGNSACDVTLVEPSGYWASYIIHTIESGTYRDLLLSDRIKPAVHQIDLWVAPGAQVRKFMGSNDALGTMILRFEERAQMLDALDNSSGEIRVELESR